MENASFLANDQRGGCCVPAGEGTMRNLVFANVTSAARVIALAAALVVTAMLVDRASAAPLPPQEAAIASAPRPYTGQEVTFRNDRGPVNLAGTLSLPNGKGPFPAVLLIAASGPEGRDEEAGGHRVFVVLADHLLHEGIAVLRYDKRGVGSSSGTFATASFEDLVSDAAVAFRYLKGRPEVDRHRVGIIGHSEGGSIAPAVAAGDQEVAFVVAMAGSGLRGEFRITEMQAYMAKESGASSGQQAMIRALCQKIFRTVKGTPDDAVANERISALIDEANAAKVLTEEQAKGTRQLMTVKFVRQELNDDPIKYLKSVHVPVLALVGSLDRIVPPEPYVAAMRPVLNTIPGSKVQILPGLNHLMQTARTGSPREFSVIKESISPLALQVIGDWVGAQVKPAPH